MRRHAFARAQRDIHADDGFDAMFQRFAIELHHREKVVLVTHRQRRHLQFCGEFEQLRNAHHAVLQRKFGVQPEVDEMGGGDARHGARVYQ
jgi:hypothetical protein